MGEALGAALFGARAAVTVYVLGYALLPDSFDYAAGRSLWSSPVAAIAGDVAGFRAEQALGVCGAIALGAAVGAGATRAVHLWPLLALYLLPLGYASWCASPDALGAAAAVLGLRAERPAGQLVAVVGVSLLHLEAGLVLGVVLVARRPLWSLSPAVSGPLAGVVACVGQWHVQARYLLPGLAIAAAELVRRQVTADAIVDHGLELVA